MKPCRECRRFVRITEDGCPFCGAALQPAIEHGRACMLGLVLGMMTAACGPGTSPTPGGGGSSSTSSADSTTAASMEVSTAMADGTTAVGTSSTEESTSEDGGGAFYAANPDGPLPSCDLLGQDCPEGEKCAPFADHFDSPGYDAARCLDVVEEPAQDGEPCMVMGDEWSGRDDCDVGLVCYELDPETDTGVCRALCDPGGAACSDPSTTCVSWFDGGLPICSPTCDPLLQDCGPGMACVGDPDIVCDAGACGISRPPNTGVALQGEPCDWPTDCELGLQCTDGAVVPGCVDARCCTEICDAADPASCDAVPGTSCVPVDSASCPPAIYDAGVCITP